MSIVTQDIATLTQKPKSFEVKFPVVGLAEVQFVTSIPIYIDAMHI